MTPKIIKPQPVISVVRIAACQLALVQNDKRNQCSEDRAESDDDGEGERHAQADDGYAEEDLRDSPAEAE